MTVSRGTRETGPASCTTCGERPRRPGQRTCAPCHAAYMVTYRAKQKAAAQQLAWELCALRAAQRKAS